MASNERIKAVVALSAVGLAAIAVGRAAGRRSRLGDETNEKSIVHRVPAVPIEIDGASVEPEEIKNYDGQPLYYVLDEKAKREGVLRVFTAAHKAQERLWESAEGGTKEAVASIGAASGTNITLWEHVGCTGQSVGLEDGQNFPDFRKLNCFLWWCTNFNDKASSVMVPWKLGTIQSKYVVLHEHINYQGSQLKIARGLIEDNLVPYGWNDRASSLSHVW